MAMRDAIFCKTGQSGSISVWTSLAARHNELMTRNLPYLVVSCTASATVMGLLWFSDIPLGIPGEWTWDRIGPPVDGWLTLCLVGIAAFFYWGFVYLGRIRIGDGRGWERKLWLGGLVIAGFSWLWVIQDSAPPEYRFAKTAWVLFYPGSSGYFSLARDHDAEFDEFLSRYDELMAEGDVLHVGTHPPGLVTAYHQLIKICRASPGLTAVLRQTEPASLAEAFAIIEQNQRGRPTALLPEHRAALWLAALLTQLAAAGTVIPLYLTLSRDYLRETAWRTAALWPLVPALALFLPKSDVLYPLIGMLFYLFWLGGWEQRSAWRCFCAGAVLFAGLCCSLALIPVALCVAGVTVWRGWCCRPDERVPNALAKLLFAKGWAGSGFLIPFFAVWWIRGINLVSIWIWNYRNHAGFYEQYTRTYWKWLLVNPVEFCIAAGIPVAIAALWGAWKIAATDSRSRGAGTLWSCLVIWGLLWLSGKNMGEVARLWILLMPWLLLLASGCFANRANREPTGDSVRWTCTLVLQFAVSLAMVMRVHGFHIPH